MLASAPGLLTVYLSFEEGGFYSGTQAFALVVLVVLLGARVVLGRNPFEGFSVPLGIAAGALALYALWTLASGIWSDSLWRALAETNRVLLYLAALIFFGSFLRTQERISWMVRLLALAITAVSIAALATRLYPDAFPTTPSLAGDRLGYPLTYWNALGMLASIGIVLCFHLAARSRGSRLVRVLGAAAVPVLATTVYFTFSRGAIVGGAIGLVAYLLLARPRGVLSGLVAVVPPALVALIAAYDADHLAAPNPTTAAATAQGHDLAVVVLAAVAAAAVLRGAMLLVDRQVARIRVTERMRKLVLRPLAGMAAAVLLIVALAAGGPGLLEEQYQRFTEGDNPDRSAERTGDVRERLTEAGSPARLRQWEVARWQFRQAELAGQGAGTYELAWSARRSSFGPVVDAHSLYQEVSGELGVVGLVLLATALIAILARFAQRMGGDDKPVYAALLAAGIAWAAHAGVDWDWEMPAVTLWVFALGGAALAASARDSRLSAPGQLVRVAITLTLLALAVFPTFLAVSEGHLRQSEEAFERGDCTVAAREAKAAISTLAVRPEPYELAGYCAIRQGDAERAVSYMEDALDRDPGNWNYHYSLAVARAAAGLDPRKEVREALRLSPHEPLVHELALRFKTDGPREWRARARELANSLVEL